MPIPEIDYDAQAIELLPLEERLPLWVIMIQSMFSATKWLWRVFVAYVKGYNYDNYDATVTYAIGDRVKYGFSTFESIADGNVGNTPGLGSANWFLLNEVFIGTMERVRYTCERLKYEYALNRYFETEFRQPVDGTSEIYILNDVPASVSFVMYPDSERSSKMYPDMSTGYMFDTPVYATATNYKYVINIPAAVYAALGTSAEQKVRRVADKLSPAGTLYRIQTY